MNTSQGDRTEAGQAGTRWFVTTRWSIVLAAGRGPTPRSQDALATLCETYWHPLYAYARRKGFNSEDAEDLIQAFFARLLEKQDLRRVDPKLGKFRSFLLASLNHFIANERDRARAKKRGGGQPILSLDMQDAEGRYQIDPADHLTPEKVFERKWALSVIDRVFARVRQEYLQRNKGAMFDRLKSSLVGETARAPYQQIAAELGTSEGNVKVAVHRLRRRFREVLREEIAQTVGAEDQIEEEIRYLFTVLGA